MAYRIYLVLTIFVFSFIGCEKINYPDSGRKAEVKILDFSIDDYTKNPRTSWEYKIEQFDESEPLDPIALYIDSHCDCDEPVYSQGEQPMDKFSGKSARGGIDPPEEATKIWVVLSWVDDTGENKIESKHISLDK